jgi:hypothetical protein
VKARTRRSPIASKIVLMTAIALGIARNGSPANQVMR